ncbi:hypothetical protein ALC62_06802 [Cyphomyrmex costatus]|uniref:Uncharacterized protein n=1 Tax=Cyphomyrmex costatus TaxID=456900 RepID=A0A195CPK3_9HYME|nr:hypothetical protein ALC62_06802 [Cyphomyrmex costatus]
MELYDEKHQTKRIILDLTDNNIEVEELISSQEDIHDQITDINKNTRPKRQRISIVKDKETSPVLTINRGIKVPVYPTLEKEPKQLTRKEYSENDKSDEVEYLPFPKQQSKETRKMGQLIQSQPVTEKEKQANMQKSKSKRIENLKVIYTDPVELLSKNKNNNDLEINKTLEPIDKLVNQNNSRNEVTHQFNSDTIKLNTVTINSTIESEACEIRHNVPQTIKYPNLTNFPSRIHKRLQNNVSRLNLKRKATLSRYNQSARKTFRRSYVTKPRRHQLKSIPTTERKRKIMVRNIRRTIKPSSETSLSDQLEKDEKRLMQKIKNELRNKQEILQRRQHIKEMCEIAQQLDKENVGYKSNKQTQQRQLQITRLINQYNQLQNKGTEYEDNFVIKDQAGHDAYQFDVKLTIKDLKPAGCCGSQIYRTAYLLEDHLLTRSIVLLDQNDSTHQEKPMIEVQTPREKKKTKRNDTSSQTPRHAVVPVASLVRRQDERFIKSIEEQTITSTNKQTSNKPKITSIEDVNFITPINVEQMVSCTRIPNANYAIKLQPILYSTSTTSLKSKEPLTENQLSESQPVESVFLDEIVPVSSPENWLAESIVDDPLNL